MQSVRSPHFYHPNGQILSCSRIRHSTPHSGPGSLHLPPCSLLCSLLRALTITMDSSTKSPDGLYEQNEYYSLSSQELLCIPKYLLCTKHYPHPDAMNDTVHGKRATKVSADSHGPKENSNSSSSEEEDQNASTTPSSSGRALSRGAAAARRRTICLPPATLLDDEFYDVLGLMPGSESKYEPLQLSDDDETSINQKYGSMNSYIRIKVLEKFNKIAKHLIAKKLKSCPGEGGYNEVERIKAEEYLHTLDRYFGTEVSQDKAEGSSAEANDTGAEPVEQDISEGSSAQAQDAASSAYL
uniref:Uncharacterized protein n=1 Tax=Sicyonia whispovirus TaxID=2984283 RepID=A0A9C7C0D4_9VIRU|nr:MAG: hypothetical protein [Sicyonia whispovirus]